MIFRALLSRKWILTTLLVLAGGVVCVRLGIWQLDRLAQRRAFNAHFIDMQSAPALDLNAEIPQDLTNMEYRHVKVTGTYDFANQVALRNQYHNSEFGYHLLTPLLLDNGSAVLVDRGWIPADGNDSPGGWSRYDEAGQVQVQGVMRLGPTKPDLGGVPDPTLTPGQRRLDFWNFANLERISQQIPYSVLPVYIQPDVNANDNIPPIPYQPEIDLTEGPHFGYAIQWFTFASILYFGYPFYLRKQLKETT
jgi:surfeit locus 1 family protein